MFLLVIKVVFYNVRLFYRYMVDFKKDFVLLLVDILVVLEIRFGEVDEIDMYFLIGFIIYRFDYFGIVYRLVYGLVIFVK